MLTPQEIKLSVEDLGPRIEGGQMQKFWQPDPETVVVRIRRPGATVFLVVSCHPSAARIGEVTDRGAVAKGAVAQGGSEGGEGSTLVRSALCDWLRATAGGRRLEGLDYVEHERIVVLRFGNGRLVAELMGRHANLFGVDADDRVVVTARRAIADNRGVGPGERYTYPTPRPATSERPPRYGTALEIEQAARERLGALALDAAATDRRRVISQVRRRLRRLRHNVQADADRFDDADRWLRMGELLKTQAAGLRRGTTTAQVTDWYAEGAPQVEIELDPKLDGRQNVQRMFTRYRRGRTGHQQAVERLRQVDVQLGEVDRIEAEEGDADAARTALQAAGLLRRRARTGGPRPKAERRLPYRVFHSRAGERILVGRGGVDNHATTFHVAKGNDHWLHARDAAGAHVVVPLPARHCEPHPETIRDAAALAAHHCKLRGEAAVDVMHTRRKHVRAVSGGTPGRVLVADAGTIVARLDDAQARIARMYAGGAGLQSFQDH